MLTAPPITCGYGADFAWLLEAIDRGSGIRINCGGADFVDSTGGAWGQARFFLGGQRGNYLEFSLETKVVS